MKNIKNNVIVTSIMGLILAGSLITFAAKAPVIETVKPQAPAQVNLDLTAKAAEEKPVANNTPPANANEYVAVSSLNVVNNPSAYLNKKIKFRAAFDKFSTLGLDYKPGNENIY